MGKDGQMLIIYLDHKLETYKKRRRTSETFYSIYILGQQEILTYLSHVCPPDCLCDLYYSHFPSPKNEDIDLKVGRNDLKFGRRKSVLKMVQIGESASLQ